MAAAAAAATAAAPQPDLAMMRRAIAVQLTGLLRREGVVKALRGL